MNKLSILIPTFIFLAGCQPSSPNPSPTPTPSPNQITTSPTPEPTLESVEIPTDWTWVYDGTVGVHLAYPADWHLRPALGTQGELAVYSFDPNQTPDSGGVPESEIKVAVTYFGATDSRQLTFDPTEIVSESRTSVDDYAATTREIDGMGGTSIVTEININPNEVYAISAYPASTTFIETYQQILDYIDINAGPPTTIDSPKIASPVTSPLTISGTAPGNWMTEGQMHIELTNTNGNLIAETTATSSQSWMTTEPIPFSATLNFTSPSSNLGILYFHQGNPSGIPSNTTVFTWPVSFR